MKNRFDFFNFRSFRKRTEKPIAVWENDGGRVPHEDDAYLVNGRLVTGWAARVGWWGHRILKHLQAPFQKRPGKTAPASP